jgi:FAD/FMN-containing dehydrogenase
LKVLAVAVAHTVSAVQSPHDDASTSRLPAADALARALTLDMADWWQPTAANYFACIRKEQIFQAIQEATGAPVKERLRSLKKQDLAECITETQKDLAASFLPAPIVGHAGDGNFHVGFVLNPSDPREMAEAERLNERVVHRALSLDGTCTGEHGIGCGKIDFLIAEHGDAMSVMRVIKKAIDPENIMNPGKILRI